jgi:23S rRNA pseudouridine1911/1915/1917 synthase
MKPDYRDEPDAPAEPDAPWSDEPERREALVPPDLHGARLDKAVVAVAGEFSRSHLQTLIDGGHVQLEGHVVTTPSRRVQAGQRIAVELVPTPQSQAFRPEAVALAVLHEDEHLLVVDKPAGLVVHPAAGNWSGTMLNGLLAHHAGAAALPRAGIVHRLDKDTSGLMVVGKSLVAVTALVRSIAAREVHREYLAIAHGPMHDGTVRIDAPIARDPQSRIRMAIVPGGKHAVTDVETVARGDGCTGLRCILHTGRTHQIRVHLASRGHPLVADVVYGGALALGLERQALHAARLAFAHPVSGEPLLFEAAPPADFATAWSQLDTAA